MTRNPFPPGYRGRLAPSPTGYLHLGHARTFWTAQERARAAGGTLVLRMDDLDGARSRPEFAAAALIDLRRFGFSWDEGPDLGGPCAPYTQSERMPSYRAALDRLLKAGHLFPCQCSRRDIRSAATAPHAGDEEPIYPGTCRGRTADVDSAGRVTWRFRVPVGETVEFTDGGQGAQRFVAGRDFGDIVVWRADHLPSYHLACTVDDALMGITEVVRGADLLLSTARQILLFRALGWEPPRYHHCALLLDERGERLAKRHDALSLRALLEAGHSPAELRAGWNRGGAGEAPS